MTAQASLFDDESTSYSAISRDGLYRYTLGRVFDPRSVPLVFVMLNPSTADASLDDPTIRRCLGFARRHGGLRVVNLYAWRATNPDELTTVDDPIGPLNDDVLRETFNFARHFDATVIAAWGAWPGPDPTRPAFIETLASARGVQLHALGVTKSGQPRHPLYLPGDAEPAPWSAP